MVKQSSKVKDKFRSRFNPAKTAQQETNKVQELKQKIKELEADPNRTSNLSGKISISILNIKSSKQCRKTFSETIIQKRMRSLIQEGQLDPVVLIPIPDDEDNEEKYQIEDGEVTWRAAKRLYKEGKTTWSKLEAVLSNSNDPDTVHFRTLLHHLHSEGLNPLDRSESIVAEINLQLDLETSQAVKLLRNIIYRSGRDSQLEEAISTISESEIAKEYLEQHLEPIQVQLISLLNRLQVELGSFVNNDLGMLTLTDELKAAIREQELSCHQAKIINKLTSKTLKGSDEEINEIRYKALDFILSNKLSVGRTRQYIDQIITEHGKPTQNSDSQTKKSYQKIKTELQKLPVNKLTKTQLNSLKLVMERQLSAIEKELIQ